MYVRQIAKASMYLHKHSNDPPFWMWWICSRNAIKFRGAYHNPLLNDTWLLQDVIASTRNNSTQVAETRVLQRLLYFGTVYPVEIKGKGSTPDLKGLQARVFGMRT